MVKIILKII